MDCKWFDEFKNGNYTLAFWGHLGKRWKDIDYVPNVDQIWNYKILIHKGENTLFSGTIKNIGELKKLMKQLNIL